MPPVDAIGRSGPFLGLVALFGAAAFAIALERIGALRARTSTHSTAFVAHVQKLVLEGEIDRARALCDAEPGRAIARILDAALACAGCGASEIEGAVHETCLEVGQALQRRAASLPMLANVATLSGLLGTIALLITAFDAVADATPDARQALLAEGLAAAMVPTFAGLLVAVPTLLVHGMIHDRTAEALDAIDRVALRAVRLGSFRREPRTPLAPPPARDLW